MKGLETVKSDRDGCPNDKIYRAADQASGSTSNFIT